MTKFIDEEELEGRTIARVVQDGSVLFIRFTDGTYTAFGTDWGYYQDDATTGFDSYVTPPKSLGVSQ